jgi:hypothetical protein
MTDKWKFFFKLAILLFLITTILGIILALFLGGTDTVALGYLSALVIIQIINFVVAILEEPITRWLM